jgi:cysteine-rich repeat protein
MFGTLGVPTADAFDQYSIDRNSGNCADCHGNFRVSPYISNVDGGSWGDDLHDVHRRTMLNSDCDTCHGATRFPVILDSSNGGTNLSAISCVGCHGREEDIGNDDTSLGRGAGLRQHHTAAGIPDCADCHSDADPAIYTPVGEDVLPSYYVLVPDSDHPDKPTDSCNPNGEEDYAAGPLGLDNDGDDLWDQDDPDCQQVVCGDGIVSPGEECDDGNTLDGDCCSSTCSFEPPGSSCADGLFCNGEETCDGAGACQAGLPVDCSDGVGCTDDLCDELADACVNDPNDANCPDDGLFCNGVEFCDFVADCQSTGDPCPVGTICSESTGTCDVAADCGNGLLEPGEECDDGNTLDGDCCSSTCTFEPVGSACEDGEFCNGAETCDGAGVCQPGLPVDCDDGVTCTVDSCDEANDTCSNAPDDTFCDDQQFCNGAEVCDLVNDCQPGTPVDCSDGVGCTDDVCDEAADACVNDPNDANCPDDGLFCNGLEFCDAVNDCSSTGDPCPAGTVCSEVSGTCDAVAACGNGILEPGEECDDGNTMDGDCCSSVCTFEPMGSSCSDGMFCNGEETCDGAGTCDAGLPVDCDDGVACTIDSCDEVADACVNTPNDNLCPDDGLFCTGVEVCDMLAGCVSTGDPCPGGTTCNDDTDTCEGVPDKVVICHIPPGNPDNEHTIRVDAAALPAHLAHGDFIGPCDDDDQDDDDEMTMTMMKMKMKMTTTTRDVGTDPDR